MVETILVDSQPFDSYQTVAQADLYLSAAIHAANWTTATEATKEQALITMTRILDRQRWQSAYDTVAEREVIQDILDACNEGALSLVDDSDIQTSQTTAQTQQSIKAGSVALTFFRGAEGAAHRFPTIVQELLRDYLVGGNLTVTGVATGTGGITSTDDDFGFNNPV